MRIKICIVIITILIVTNILSFRGVLSNQEVAGKSKSFVLNGRDQLFEVKDVKFMVAGTKFRVGDGTFFCLQRLKRVTYFEYGLALQKRVAGSHLEVIMQSAVQVYGSYADTNLAEAKSLGRLETAENVRDYTSLPAEYDVYFVFGYKQPETGIIKKKLLLNVKEEDLSFFFGSSAAKK